ncbi:glyoxylate/hydroxypyruvate reductase A [Martelella sp. HB161492]|uniref:2-hydroxyacid dehydrogenase n=1 Tax=Martelella sp. HB161492 TaxID=2720726 RepID=UPI0015918E4D|nr:glyoxylate/hydroxypyruvate reductase A [Martelella sp. HB161492]
MTKAKGTILVDLKFTNPQAVADALPKAFAGREVVNLADPEHAGRDLSDCRYALLWKPDADLFTRARNLDVLFSGGAGVDRIMALEGLPDLPLVRFVDGTLTRRMSEYVVLQALTHLRQMPTYARQQRQAQWRPSVQPEACAVTVGVMGLGVLGCDAVEKLKIMGFNVIGWSRRKRVIAGLETFDAAGLDAFLAQTDILVGLLPLTAETTGLFNASLFAKLRQGGALSRPVFINAGRGGSQVEADIVAALQEGVLGGVSLDVFEKEPLDAESPLWAMDRAILTPHVAADSDVASLLAHVERQIARFEAGAALEHLVDHGAGY